MTTPAQDAAFVAAFQAANSALFTTPAFGTWAGALQTYQTALAGGGGGSAVTLDPAHTDTHLTLSNGNLTATANALFSFANSRSTTAHSSGKYYVEVVSTNPSDGAVGLASASESPTNYLGQTVNSVGYYNTGDVYFNGAQAAAVATWGATFLTSVIDVAIDLDNKKIWVKVDNGTWNRDSAANPATNTGGVSIAALANAPFFFVVEPYSSGAALTVNFGATSFVNAAPSGFGNW